MEDIKVIEADLEALKKEEAELRTRLEEIKVQKKCLMLRKEACEREAGTYVSDVDRAKEEAKKIWEETKKVTKDVYQNLP